jgi:histidine triad (HIT) family protein
VTLADLPTELLGPFFERVARMQLVVERAMGAAGAFVAMNNRVSQSVPHLHAHVVPRTKGDGLRGFFWPRTTYRDAEDMAEVGERLATTYAKVAGERSS